jgi:hypothetical protein
MCAAVVSHTQVNEYLKFMMERELVGYEQETGLYFLKDNGLLYMRAYDKIKELLSPMETKSELELLAR